MPINLTIIKKNGKRVPYNSNNVYSAIKKGFYAMRTDCDADIRLIFKHILPNSLGTIITSSVFMITSVIFSEASLAYLNLGLQGVHSFGVMISNNQAYITESPNLVVFPAVIISLLMISFNLFGNGLRDAVNPSLKGSD